MASKKQVSTWLEIAPRKSASKQPTIRKTFYREVAAIIHTAQAMAYQAVDTHMVAAYWQVGQHIVEEEQLGEARADAGPDASFEL
jgi:hypothetical protein